MSSGLSGSFNKDDELAVYANGVLVGATKITYPDSPIAISAWGAVDILGTHYRDGYTLKDEIELRLWSQSENRELRIVTNLDEDKLGVGPGSFGTASVSDQDAVPNEMELSQNYPNPFNPSTRIEYTLASEGYITLNIYDITGRLISTLIDDYVDSGYHSVMWNGMDDNGKIVAAGIYFYSLQSETSNMTRKMVYMK